MNQPDRREVSLPSADDLTAKTQIISKLHSQWVSHRTDSTQSVQGYVLEHDYAETNLRFNNLKGRDREVVDALCSAKSNEGQPLFVVCLLLLEKYESGSAEYEDYGYGSSGIGGMEEVHDSSTSTSLWIGPDDKQMKDFGLSVDLEECLLTDEAIEDLFGEDPVKEETEGYTDNAGPTIEHWCYRGAVAFWPKAKNLDVSTRAGLSFVVSCLNSAEDVDIPKLATGVVALLEQKKGKVDPAALRALLRAGDSTLATRAFKAISSIGDANLATEMVSMMKALKDDQLNAAALAALENTASLNSGISIVAHFLNLLALSGVESLVPSAREAIVRWAMVNAENLMS